MITTITIESKLVQIEVEDPETGNSGVRSLEFVKVIEDHAEFFKSMGTVLRSNIKLAQKEIEAKNKKNFRFDEPQ